MSSRMTILVRRQPNHPDLAGVIRVQALTSCRWYTRSCRKQRPSESAANAEPFEHWPGRDHWSRSTLSKLRAIISAAAASSAETTACSCDQYHSASAVVGAAVKVRFGSSPPNPNTVQLGCHCGVAGLLLGLRPVVVVGAFDVPLGHLALDDPWRGAQAPGRVEASDQPAQEGQPESLGGDVVRGERRPGGPR